MDCSIPNEEAGRPCKVIRTGYEASAFLGDSLVLHCTFLLCTIFASSARHITSVSFLHVRAKFVDLLLRALLFFFFVFRVNFDGNCGEYAVKGHRRKQTDILVSFVFPAVLETLIFSSFFLTFYQKHDFASDSLCLRVVCDRSKLIWLPQSNVTLKSFIVFNRMCLSSGNDYIGPYSPVKWLRSGVYGR